MEFDTSWNRHLSNSLAESPADFVQPGTAPTSSTPAIANGCASDSEVSASHPNGEGSENVAGNAVATDSRLRTGRPRTGRRRAGS